MIVGNDVAGRRDDDARSGAGRIRHTLRCHVTSFAQGIGGKEAHDGGFGRLGQFRDDGLHLLEKSQAI